MPDEPEVGSRAWLGLGANLGDRAATLREAVRRLAATPSIEVTACSGLYRTPPWGVTDQPDFLNAAVAIRTTLPPHALLDACLAVEAALGRVRERRWGPRTVDIDILAYENAVLADARLTLPQRGLADRAFALAPLAEIEPDLLIGGEAAAALLARLDRTGLERVAEP